MDCIFCWTYNELHPRQFVELKSSKYYNLCPKYSKKKIPNFEHCKILYTKCDYNRERKVHEHIIKLEELFKKYQKLIKQELEMQKSLLDDMWVQSQRFNILIRSGVCIKPYPEIVSVDTERRALCIFFKSFKQINRSNCILSEFMKTIESRLSELNTLCKELDMRVESPFIIGCYYLKSLSSIRDILNDLYCYFYSNLCKMKCWAQLLDPGDLVSVEDYMTLIKSDKENEITDILPDCCCLRKKMK